MELIDGAIIDMAPIGQGHAVTVGGLNRALVMACGNKAIVWVQNPVRLDRLNEPEPDFAVKLPLYARAGIPEFCIMDLKHRALDAFRRPTGGQRAEVATYRPGDHLALAAAADITVRLDLALA